MAKTASNTFKDIMASLRNRQFARVYLLSGEEEYFIDAIVKMLEENVVDPADRDFNQTVFYGADAVIEEVAAAARQFPMMAPRRLVILKEAQALDRAKSQLEKLAPFMERPVDTTVFVVAYKGEALSGTSKLVKSAVKNDAVVFRSDCVKDYQIAPYIRDYCEARRLRIDEKAIRMLTEMQGTELKKIFSEIDKIVVAEAGKVSVINDDLVARHTGFNKDFNNFELSAALADKNYPKAMQIVDYFSRSPKQHPGIVTASLLFSFYSRLAIALCLKDRSDASIMAALKAKSPYAIKEIKTGMTRYSLRQAALCVSAIRDYDTQAKGIGSTKDEYDLLRELVFRLVTV